MSEPDQKQCEQVNTAVVKVMEVEPPNIEWMTGEFANELHQAIYAGYTFVFMELLKRGVPQDDAQRSAQMQAPLLAFQLGMSVGKELEATRAMREMFGDA